MENNRNKIRKFRKGLLRKKKLNFVDHSGDNLTALSRTLTESKQTS